MPWGYLAGCTKTLLPFEICGQEDFKACLEEDDLEYFEEQNEDRLLHSCPICGRKNSN